MTRGSNIFRRTFQANKQVVFHPFCSSAACVPHVDGSLQTKLNHPSHVLHPHFYFHNDNSCKRFSYRLPDSYSLPWLSLCRSSFTHLDVADWKPANPFSFLALVPWVFRLAQPPRPSATTRPHQQPPTNLYHHPAPRSYNLTGRTPFCT